MGEGRGGTPEIAEALVTISHEFGQPISFPLASFFSFFLGGGWSRSQTRGWQDRRDEATDRLHL